MQTKRNNVKLATIDLVPYSTVQAALSIDAGQQRDPGRYRDSNEFSYYLLCNTWYGLIQDLSEDPFPEFLGLLSTKGLIASIREAVEVSDAVVNERQLPNSPFLLLLDRLSLDLEGKRKYLQLLRYPKRFSPRETESLVSETVDGFLKRNLAAKVRDKTEYPYWIMKSLNLSFREIFSNFSFGNPSIPTGATADCSNDPLSKRLKIMDSRPLAFGNISYLPNYIEHARLENHPNLEYRYNKGITVPKSYKARRFIAAEETYRQYLMNAVSSGLDFCLSHPTFGHEKIDIHDQSRNQALARQGSVDGSLATIDLTAASDSMSFNLIDRLLEGTQLRALLRESRSNFVEVNGKPKVLYLYATMGSRVTFPIETALFYSIAKLATEMQYDYTPDIPLVYSSYGDDIILPSAAAPLCCEILSILGFSVNQEKSYWTGNYRESCGEEYYAGYNLSSVYFPRHEIPDDKVGVYSTLISLQHKLVSYRRVNTFLTTLIRWLYPAVTESFIGSQYDDLWSRFPTTKYKYLGGIDNEAARREVHTTIKSKFRPLSEEVSSKLADEFAYQDFLEHGPKFADPLSQLLGVSERRDPRAFVVDPDQVIGTSLF